LATPNKKPGPRDILNPSFNVPIEFGHWQCFPYLFHYSIILFSLSWKINQKNWVSKKMESQRSTAL